MAAACTHAELPVPTDACVQQGAADCETFHNTLETPIHDTLRFWHGRWILAIKETTIIWLGQIRQIEIMIVLLVETPGAVVYHSA
jgi:hypothetical protein